MARRSIMALVLMAGALAAAPAAAQSVEELARQLAQPAAPAAAATPAQPACVATLPDGSCADQPDTRQMVLRRPSAAVASAASSVARVIRADINMSFLVGSAELTNQARATLDRFAAALVRAGSYRPFTVEGHTDRSGSPETNRVLSQARAASVVNYLASKGVDRSRLTAQGYGSERPLAGRSANDPANRRVEVVAR